MHRLLLILTFLIFICFPGTTFAKENSQFITIVNPIRISIYSLDPITSLINQYTQVKVNHLPASWLFTYDAISYPGITKVIKSMDPNQDIGIFMEVTENFSKASGVIYNKTDSWHRSNSVFLSGYSQSDRLKLIDTVFNKFKDELGYYPTSVGAWWIDSYSLEYMQKKYGVNANLVVSDQFETDGYTIWGQYWAAPFYPSKNHAAIPAQDLENKLDIVNLQWAPRDPLNGYKTPTNFRASLYSTQDYYTASLPDQYFEKLINLYAGKNNNDFGQITFGLEGDFPPESYLIGGQYEKYIKIAKKFVETGEYTAYNMKQFSQWYRMEYPLSYSYFIETDDLLDKPIKIIWYQTSRYRIGLTIDKSTSTLKIFDLRAYQKNLQEPFFNFPNQQLDLYINLPSIIDSMALKNNYLEFKDTNFKKIIKNENSYRILFNNDKFIDLEIDRITFTDFKNNLPPFILKSPYVTLNKGVNKFSFLILEKFPYNEPGYIFRDLTIKSSYFLKQNKVIAISCLGIIIYFFSLLVIIKFISYEKRRVLFPLFIFLIFLTILILYLKYSENYYVSQAELDALFKLKSLPEGKILILNKDCLPCQWNIKYKVAAFANKRSYVKRMSQKDLILDTKLIEFYAHNYHNFSQIKKAVADDYLRKLNVDYIYLVKHEGYQEKLPYSPGDLGVEQIFVNSDAQIWKLK